MPIRLPTDRASTPCPRRFSAPASHAPAAGHGGGRLVSGKLLPVLAPRGAGGRGKCCILAPGDAAGRRGVLLLGALGGWGGGRWWACCRPLFLARRLVRAGGGGASRGLRGVGGSSGAPPFLGLRGASGRGRCSILGAWGRGGGPGQGGASCCPFGGVGGVGAWCPDVRGCLGGRRPQSRDCTRRVF